MRCISHNIITTNKQMTDYDFISKSIKNITIQNINSDYDKLVQVGNNASLMSPRCRIGNDVVDYFTFKERLNTRGKYDINFFEFVEQIEDFKKKKFIRNMLVYYDTVKNKNKTKNTYVVLKEVYNICISAINIFRPIVSMEVYSLYKPTSILDFCAGWGGRLVGACALNIDRYTGIDINTNLKPGYDDMIQFLNTKSTTEIAMHFVSATLVDYSQITYDLVLTSPPYYSIEKYSNNEPYESKSDMNTMFYTPVIMNTYKYLSVGGRYCLNINKEMYDKVCVPVLGCADEILPFKKSKRQNEYSESIYVWFKH